MHNTGLATATSSLYVYPSGVSDVSVGQTAYRLARVDLASNETFFFEMNYPLVLTNQKIVVEVTQPATEVGGAGIEVRLTSKSLATQIFEVIDMGARSTGNHPTTTKADGHLLEYFRQTFGAGGGGTNYVDPGSGHTATGGVINDYSEGGSYYRAHIFTGSGTFEVTELINLCSDS